MAEGVISRATSQLGHRFSIVNFSVWFTKLGNEEEGRVRFAIVSEINRDFSRELSPRSSVSKLEIHGRVRRGYLDRETR